MTDNRRRFLRRGATLCGLTVAGSVALPAIGSLMHPLLGEPAEAGLSETALGPVERFPVGAVVKVPITSTRRDAWTTTRDVTVGAVYVLRKEDNDFLVLSTVCPHLGCAIATRDGGFGCPCHGAVFEADGRRSGADNPAPRDMDEMKSTVRDGTLFCEFVEYAPGVAEKRPLRGLA